jgi:lysophospholipase L1-like esterase
MRAVSVVGRATALAWVCLAAASASAAPRCAGQHWLGVWAASPAGSVGGAFVDATVRLVVHPTREGRRARVRLSNRFGSMPVTFGAVAIARRGAGAEAISGSVRRLRFGRRLSVTVPPGGEVVSDQRRFSFGPFEDLLVSLHVRGPSGPATAHPLAYQTSYSTTNGAGDRARDEGAGAFTQTIGSWPFLTDIEVQAPRRVGAVVALGDSITDGFGSPPGENLRYPDALARRIAAAGVRMAVQNAGIGGNTILRPGILPRMGPSLRDRLDLDALDQRGARVVILMEGTNDIGVPPLATAAAVIAGLEDVVSRLHAAGLRVILGTLPPCKDFPLAAHGTPEAIAKRNEINAWIRSSTVADAVVDFHAALRDPGDPDRLDPAYDVGDHLHPNAAGYAAMANVIDLEQLTGSSCR